MKVLSILNYVSSMTTLINRTKFLWHSESKHFLCEKALRFIWDSWLALTDGKD